MRDVTARSADRGQAGLIILHPAQDQLFEGVLAQRRHLALMPGIPFKTSLLPPDNLDRAAVRQCEQPHPGPHAGRIKPARR